MKSITDKEIEKTLSKICTEMNVNIEAVKGPCSMAELNKVRYIFYKRLSEYYKIKTEYIGAFVNRQYPSVKNGLKVFNKNPELQKIYNNLYCN